MFKQNGAHTHHACAHSCCAKTPFCSGSRGQGDRSIFRVKIFNFAKGHKSESGTFAPSTQNWRGFRCTGQRGLKPRPLNLLPAAMGRNWRNFLSGILQMLKKNETPSSSRAGASVSFVCTGVTCRWAHSLLGSAPVMSSCVQMMHLSQRHHYTYGERRQHDCFTLT